MAQLSQLAIVASVHGYFNYEETTPAPRRPCNINDDSQFLDRQTSCSPLSLSLRLELHWLSLHFFTADLYLRKSKATNVELAAQYFTGVFFYTRFFGAFCGYTTHLTAKAAPPHSSRMATCLFYTQSNQINQS